MSGNSNGFINKVIQGYQDTKNAIVKKFADEAVNVMEEVPFLDDGTLQVKIAQLKEQYTAVVNELELAHKYEDKKDAYTKQKYAGLIQQQNRICIQLAFVASNDIGRIDDCLHLLQDTTSDFKTCLMAIKAYVNDDHDQAMELFFEYFKDKTGLIEHYLINKIYGQLMYEKQQYVQASVLLRKAVEKRPEDMELHVRLRDIYREIGEFEKADIQEQILQVLR